MMKLYPARILFFLLLFCGVLPGFSAQAQVIISQYYEGTGVNKWIELTNLSGSEVNTASPQLKLGLWSISGDAGNINLTGTPSQTVSLTVVIPAYGTVLIGRGNNGTEVQYLTAASAAQLSDAVINFNGNDAVALLDASNNVIDAFGHGVNAKDVSYVRNTDVLSPKASFTVAEWTRTPITVVQDAADLDDSNRLGAHMAANLPACIKPANQPTALTFGATNTTSFSGSFNGASNVDEYLIVMSTSSTLSAQPEDGKSYSIGESLGGGTVVSRGPANTFKASDLTPSTNYYFFVYSLNNSTCNGGPLYLLENPLNGSHATTTPPTCTTPTSQATNFSVSYFTSTKIQGKFDAFDNGNEYLVVMSTSSSLSALPANGTDYKVGNTIGNGVVVQKSAALSFISNELEPNTTYYFFVFAASNNCTGGPLYLTNSPLTGSQQTREQNSGTLNFYYGNLHAHSSYSDGNKDDLTKTPIQNYAYAKEGMRMDFLGISEHNHTGAGMKMSNWQLGLDAAKASTSSSFVALYGMEWGTISGGGHVIVYGLDSLVNWESGQYQIYVPKGSYTGATGLFNRINKHGGNAIAYLAHPNTSDYNNLAASYDQLCDKAVIGTAVESGPAFSTSTNYMNPGSSMSYLSYYNKMLSKGYYLGPTIDHDNHNFTFGRTTRSRLVVLAPALTEDYLLEAMKSKRFYATQDYDAKVYFTINSQPMGSVFTDKYAPQISVNTETASPVSSIKLMHGIPGSDISATVIASSTGATLTYTDNALANLATGYYYLDITEDDGSRTITSPIWYTRDDNTVLSVADKLNNPTKLNVWPNPTIGNINVSFDLAKRDKVRLSVISLTGQVVAEEILNGTIGHVEKQLNLGTVAKGLYILQVQVGMNTTSKKIVIQ